MAVHRRAFLVSTIAFAAGCGRRSSGPVVRSEDLGRIASQKQDRERHLELLQRFRVPATATRTTPRASTDVLATAPELKGLIKVTVRLHPRYSDEPKADESKLGGAFQWPAREAWPTCEEHGTPFVPVLQLRQDDAPPNWEFFPGTDLMQLLWCPRDHGTERVKPRIVWRKRADMTGPLAEAPKTDQALPGYVPVPCRVFPERVMEFPPAGLLPESVRKKIAGIEGYDDLLSVCPGTKVGGWPAGAKREDKTACDHCERAMDYLLTISGAEWNQTNWKRWMPTEEQASRSPEADQGYGRAAGLALDRPVNVFVCRRCDDWPAKVIG